MHSKSALTLRRKKAVSVRRHHMARSDTSVAGHDRVKFEPCRECVSQPPGRERFSWNLSF